MNEGALGWEPTFSLPGGREHLRPWARRRGLGRPLMTALGSAGTPSPPSLPVSVI